MTVQNKIASSTNKRAIYEHVIELIEWKKIDVPVKKDQFGKDDKW